MSCEEQIKEQAQGVLVMMRKLDEFYKKSRDT